MRWPRRARSRRGYVRRMEAKRGDQAKLQSAWDRLTTKSGPYEDQMFVDQLSNVNRAICAGGSESAGASYVRAVQSADQGMGRAQGGCGSGPALTIGDVGAGLQARPFVPTYRLTGRRLYEDAPRARGRRILRRAGLDHLLAGQRRVAAAGDQAGQGGIHATKRRRTVSRARSASMWSSWPTARSAT